VGNVVVVVVVVVVRKANVTTPSRGLEVVIIIIIIGKFVNIRFKRFVNYSNPSTRSWMLLVKVFSSLSSKVDLADARLGNLNRAGGGARLGADRLDSLDDIHTLGNAAENNVLTVQPAGGGGAQEELRTVRTRAGVGHGEDTRTGVLEGEVFILKLVTVDGLTTGTVVVGEITALAHEARDHAVERRAFVAKALFARAERAKVFCVVGKVARSRIGG
jgi:hypothetical protein